MTCIARDRIGVDVGRKLRLEDAVAWAGENDVRIIDIQLDTGENVVTSFDQAHAHAIRRMCDHHAIRLGLHTLSAVNVAEYAPFVDEAVDAYLRAYIDAAVLLGGGMDRGPRRFSFLSRHRAASAGGAGSTASSG